MKTFGNFDFTPVRLFPFTGLFHRCISQSGTATCSWPVKCKGIPKAIAQQMAGLFDCPAHPSKHLISCLRKQDAYKLYSADLAIKVSCHIHAENIIPLKSGKTSNYHDKHSRPGSTNWPACIDFKYSAWKNPVYDFRKLITPQKQSSFLWAILHYTPWCKAW
jgi:hypothetical protein